MSDLPMPDTTDGRLERELRGLLADREPGGAPYALRDRVDRVPDTAARGERAAIAAGVIGTAMIAAAVVIAVVALGGRQAIDPASVGASPAPDGVPFVFGPGIVAAPEVHAANYAAALLVLGLVALAAGLALRDRRRAAVGVVAAAFIVPIVALMLSLLPAARADESDGAYVSGIQRPDMPAGYQGFQLVYVAGESFETGFSLANTGPLPIRVHGVIGSPDDALANAHWTGVEVIDDPAQRQTAIGRPFEALMLAPGESVFVRLTGVPGPCGTVLADPAAPAPAGVDFVPLDMWVAYDVLGWPRTGRLETSWQITAPTSVECEIDS
jgi:hypothetical protein